MHIYHTFAAGVEVEGLAILGSDKEVRTVVERVDPHGELHGQLRGEVYEMVAAYVVLAEGDDVG